MISASDFSKKQIIVFYPAHGDKMAFSNDNIIIRDGEGTAKFQSTCYRLFAIFVIGDTSITTGLIKRSKKFGFSICLFSNSLKLYEVIGSRTEGNTLLHMHQYQMSDIDIGQRIIENKISNQKSALNKIRNKTEDNKKAIRSLDNYRKRLVDVKMPLLSILGIEGSASKIYFQEIFDNAEWNGRKPRIKVDYINSTLDIGYTLLFNVIDALLNIYGFDTYYGVLHRCFYMRKSLVCDLIEPFRPIIDITVRKGINLRQIQSDDFVKYDNKMQLKWENSARYTELFMKAILEYKDDIFIYVQNYYRNFMKGQSVEEYKDFLV